MPSAKCPAPAGADPSELRISRKSKRCATVFTVSSLLLSLTLIYEACQLASLVVFNLKIVLHTPTYIIGAAGGSLHPTTVDRFVCVCWQLLARIHVLDSSHLIASCLVWQRQAAIKAYVRKWKIGSILPIGRSSRIPCGESATSHAWQPLSCDLSYYKDVYRSICLSLSTPHHTRTTTPPSPHTHTHNAR